MKRIPVDSSCVRSVGYDPTRLTLEVEFRNGTVFEFRGVRPEHHRALMDAPSVGKHFQNHVRGRDQSRRLDGDPSVPEIGGSVQ